MDLLNNSNLVNRGGSPESFYKLSKFPYGDIYMYNLKRHILYRGPPVLVPYKESSHVGPKGKKERD